MLCSDVFNIRESYYTGLQLPVVIALAVVIGVCLVGISYLVWQKKRVKAFRQYKQLYVDSRN